MNISSLRLFSLAAFVVLATGAFAQSGATIEVQSTPFHRFVTQDETPGHFLTASYSEGTGSPYDYTYQPFPAQADIVPVVPGYVPEPDQGLLPLYRWQVVESSRTHYYYSVDYSDLGSNYHFQGVAGYVLPNSGEFGGQPLHRWYSQLSGYSYTLNDETPPGSDYTSHDVPFFLPVAGSISFFHEEVPEQPRCFGFEPQRDECVRGGGVWSNTLCVCRHIIYEP